MITSYYGNSTMSDSESDSETHQNNAKKRKLSDCNKKNDSYIRKIKKTQINNEESKYQPQAQSDYNLSLPPTHTNAQSNSVNSFVDNKANKSMNKNMEIENSNQINDKTDEEIIHELKQKACLLKKLGGEMPPELKQFIVDDDDEVSNDGDKVNLNDKSKTKSTKISLTPNYDDDSDTESEKMSLDVNISKLSNEPRRQPTIKKVKLSARGRELIKASETTRKARASSLYEMSLAEKTGTDKDKEMSNENLNKNHIEKQISDSSKSLEVKNKLALANGKGNVEQISKKKSNILVQDSDTDTFDRTNIEEIASTLKDQLNVLKYENLESNTVNSFQIQIETLYGAWKAEALLTGYLISNFSNISQKMKQIIESNIIPGWTFHWDRNEKSYCFTNETIGKKIIQYKMPRNINHTIESKIIKRDQSPNSSSAGAQDMELSNTPPDSPTSYIQLDMDTLPPGTEEDWSYKSSEPIPPSPPSHRPAPPSSPVPPPPPPITPPPQPPPPPPPRDPIQPALPPPPPPRVSTLMPPPKDNTFMSPPPVPPPPQISRDHRTPTFPAYSSAYVAPMNPMNQYMLNDFNQTEMIQRNSIQPSLSVMKNDFLDPSLPMSSSHVSAPQMVPPPRTSENPKLLSELNSFYSDLATISKPEDGEPLEENNEREKPMESSSNHDSDEVSVKKKKKSKLAPVSSLKMKQVSSLVAKWQKVKEEY